MRLDKIRNNPILSQFIEDTCCEEGVCVTIADEIMPDDYLIIKVDKYYNSFDTKLRPPSVDCLIIRKCNNNLNFGLTLVELKSGHTGNCINNSREKFETTLYDFIKRVFKDELDIDYSDIKLFFVSNIEIYRRDIGLKMDAMINTKFKFNNRTLMITPRMPHPTIKQCY